MRIERVDPVVIAPKTTTDKLIKAVNKISGSTIFVWQDAWVATTEYLAGDVVSNGGSKWLALTTNTNITPVEGVNWTELSGGASGVKIPRYTNPFGAGFRRQEITINLTGGLSSGDPITMLYGYPMSAFFWQTSTAARSIEFVFPEAVRMIGVTFQQDVTNSQGSWQAAGSNDGTTWTDMGAPFTWGGALFSEGLWTNIAFYLRYRFTLASGSTSSPPWQQQIFFKLTT